MSFSAIQKCVITLRYLGYDISFDTADNYLKISKRIANEFAYHFYTCVYEIFHKEYLCKPIRHDIERLYLAHEEIYGFP